MDRADAAPAGVWQYKARWRSTIGSVVIFMLLMTALLALAALPKFSIGMASAALFTGWLAWWIGKPLFTGAWVVRIGPRGISGHMLNGRTVPWDDVRDLSVESIQGNTMLVLHLDAGASETLRKTRRWLSGRKPERRIPLNGLRKNEIDEAVAAARSTFAERASGQAIAAVKAREEEARLELAFEQELAHRTRVTWALYLLVSLNVGVWLWNLVAGVNAFQPSPSDLFRWGANSAWAVTREQEYWRLLTGTFLHGGLLHLGMNMLGLWGAGKLLNRLYGNGQFLLIYGLSALAGSAASLHFAAQASVAVGASGAVFGVLGAVLVAARRYRAQLPKALTRQIITSEGIFLVYALVNGFTRQGIDNAAHVGGMLAGAALAWGLAPLIGPATERSRALRTAAAGAVLALVIVVAVSTTPPPRVDHRALFAATEQLQRVVPRIQAAHAALQKDAQQAQAGRMSEAQLIEVVETLHLPALRAVHADLREVPLGHGDPRAETTQDMLLLTGKTVEALELQLRVHRGAVGPEDHTRAVSLKTEIQLISRRLQERFAAAAKKKS